jgi:hypothetical protein
MSMHLCGPALTMTGKKKGKVKFRNAEEARKARELDESWKQLQKKWAVEAEDKKRKRAMTAEPLSYNLSIPEGRSTKHLKSLGQSSGVAALKPVQMYTGDEMLGIGQLHKSNAVPIFRQQDAEDLARMRR